MLVSASALPEPPARRRYLPPDELLPLFEAIGRFRTLTLPHAHHLVLSKLDGGRTLRTSRYRVSTLIAAGYLDVFSIPARPPVRFLHLTRAPFTRWPQLEAVISDNARKAPAKELAVYAWQRAALAVTAQAAGFTVGRDLAALTALRRSLIDRQQARIVAAPLAQQDRLQRVLATLRALPLLQPWTTAVCEGCDFELPVEAASPRFCEHCGGTFRRHVVAKPHQCARCGCAAERPGHHEAGALVCPGTLRLIDYLPFDLAWRRTSSGYDVQVLFVDNPYRSLQAQLDELPLRVIGQPLVTVVLRPSDDGTVFDRLTSTYAVKGPRFRALLRAFAETTAKPDAFPFWTTAEVVPEAVYPETHFRLLTHTKDEP